MSTSTKKVAPTLSKAQASELAKIDSVSGKIRFLNSEQYARADIARILKKKYQHVRNVLEDDILKAQSEK